MTERWSRTVIAITVIAGMLITGIGFAFAEPYHVLSGRDKVGTYGKDGKSARTGYLNTVTFEGTTTDTNETVLSPVDPTSDNIILLPDTSGTMALTSSTLTGTFTGTVNGTILDSTDTNIFVSNGTSMESVTMSGDATIANTGAVSLAVNSVSAPQLGPLNTVTITIASEQTGIDTLVEAGSKLLRVDKISGFNNTVTITKSLIDTTSGSSLENYYIINTDAQSAARIVNAVFIRP
jgi:hypothetical protein